MSVSSLLEVGTVAPDLEAEASDGKRYTLRELLRESNVVLIFYPGNDTPG
ncbi:MAG TPA: redoxin domain-containing protein [Gemmatimonadaceae bacterium]|jgi:peroxiredoxin|nr:redoxin domain-containing protein [Gemmatimonadaceae bacterium]